MRVIAGKARRIQLKTIDGMDTRPTTDRIKETLFNMIVNDLYDCSFLDLFAGSGAIGIEALSRGAKETVFVEQSQRACQCIKDNLKATRLEEQAMLISSDVHSALSRLSREKEHFDIIFMDPPYRHELEKDVLKDLSDTELIDEDTMIIVESDLATTFDYLEDYGYRLIKEKRYKTNKHVFIKTKKHGEV